MLDPINAILPLIIGTTVMIGGVAVNVGDVINEAKTAVNQANIHQLSTAIEIYYSDHSTYPPVAGGEALIEELSPYLKNRPLDSQAFAYTIKANGQDYILSLK